jgi:microcystin-dependent protein
LAGYPLPQPKARFFDANGDPLAGGKLYAYGAGGTTPVNTYTASDLLTPNANPVVLDANGEANVYIADASVQIYKFVLKNSADVIQWTEDNVQVPATASAPAAQAVPTGSLVMTGKTAADTGYLLCDGSAVSRTTYSALFTAISTRFGGGDGSTTFNVPDMRQKFPLGKAASGTGSTLGGSGGTIDHVHTGAAHTHSVVVTRDGWGSVLNTPGVTGRVQTGNAGGTGGDASEYQATADVTITSGAASAGNTGTANAPFVSVNFQIKT